MRDTPVPRLRAVDSITELSDADAGCVAGLGVCVD